MANKNEPTSFRFPFVLPEDVHPEVKSSLLYLHDGVKDLNDAIRALSPKVNTQAAQIAAVQSQLAGIPVVIQPGVSIPTIDSSPGDPGVSLRYSREDHIHPSLDSGPGTRIPTIDNGAGSAGVSLFWSREDHVHPEVLAYGNMYADNVTVTVTIAATDTYVGIPSGMTGGLCSGFTFQNARELLCSVAGVYVVNWSLSVSSGTNNQEVEGDVMVNNVETGTMAAHCEIINSGKPMVVSGTGIISLAAGAVVSLGVSEHTAIHDIVVQHATLSLVRIE